MWLALALPRPSSYAYSISCSCKCQAQIYLYKRFWHIAQILLALLCNLRISLTASLKAKEKEKEGKKERRKESNTKKRRKNPLRKSKRNISNRVRAREVIQTFCHIALSAVKLLKIFLDKHGIASVYCKRKRKCRRRLLRYCQKVKTILLYRIIVGSTPTIGSFLTVVVFLRFATLL